MSDASPIYLDYNATTPLLPEVVDAMLPYLRSHFGNPSSAHAYGARARAAVDRSREQVAALLGCQPAEVLFTSGGTEASNLAIRGVVEGRRRPGAIVTSAIEHPATAKPCAWLADNGHSVRVLGVDSLGVVSLEQAREQLAGGAALVTVMHSHNETGVLQPIRELAELARAAGAKTHTDAAQSVGKVPVNAKELGVDLISIAGHKLYAPKGVGALFVKEDLHIEPLLRGASHERGIRPGTENVASIVGLGAACVAAGRDLAARAAELEALRDTLWESLSREVPGLALNGHPTLRLPNTLNVRFPRARGSEILALAPEVAASTGSACHAGHEQASSGIVAMGVPATEALGSVRLTLGRFTTRDEVDTAAAALVRAWRACSSQSAG
jgi:cysteine desulfurase